jgi:hypothetical protein
MLVHHRASEEHKSYRSLGMNGILQVMELFIDITDWAERKSQFIHEKIVFCIHHIGEGQPFTN